MENLFPDAVNGSLWTVKIELKWYLYLLILGMIASIMKPEWRQTVILVFLLVLLFYYFVFHHAQTRLERSWTMDYGMYFCSGALMFLCRDKWRNIYWLFAMMAGAVAFYFQQAIMAVLFMLVPTVVIFGKSATFVLKDFSRFGDFSYGIYLYAFMLQQTFAWYFGNKLSFMIHLALVTIMSFVCAFFSWHLIEKPALKLKNVLGCKNFH